MGERVKQTCRLVKTLFKKISYPVVWLISYRSSFLNMDGISPEESRLLMSYRNESSIIWFSGKRKVTVLSSKAAFFIILKMSSLNSICP